MTDDEIQKIMNAEYRPWWQRWLESRLTRVAIKMFFLVFAGILVMLPTDNPGLAVAFVGGGLFVWSLDGSTSKKTPS